MRFGQRCKDQGKSADPAKEHQRNQNHSGDWTKLRRNAQGQSHCPDGRGGFKQSGDQRNAFYTANQHTAGQK